MPSLAYIDMDQTNTAFHQCLHLDAIFGHCYMYLHVYNLVYHSDEIPLDIGFSLTGLLPMHCVY